MNRNFEDELKAQEELVFLWKWGNAGAALLFLLIAVCGGQILVSMVLFTLQGLNHLFRWPPVRDEMERRKKLVAFKQQFENLYIFSQYPEDQEVMHTFQKALDLLKESGNQHEVRVHANIFGDPAIFTYWYGTDGRLNKERTMKEKGFVGQTWEQYLEWCDKFEVEDREKRRVQLRKDSEGFEWNNQFIYNQI